MAPKPPAIVDLAWQHDLVFDASSGTQRLTLDGDSSAGVSPVQTLAMSLAGCMAMDVAAILAKGRHPLRAMRAHLQADRAPQHPHRFLTISLNFVIEGNVPSDAVARAIMLSRDTYCSVWHSMRTDIEFTTNFEVRP